MNLLMVIMLQTGDITYLSAHCLGCTHAVAMFFVHQNVNITCGIHLLVPS